MEICKITAVSCKLHIPKLFKHFEEEKGEFVAHETTFGEDASWSLKIMY